MTLEELGRPTVLLGTSAFTDKARAELRTWGLPDTRYLDVPHRYGQLDEAAFTTLVEALGQQVVRLLTREADKEGT